MKRHMVFFLWAFMLAGCSKYGYVNLDYPQPPAVYLPEDIGRVAIVNRSLTSAEEKPKNVLESILTGEIAGSDRLASDESLRGVYDAVQGWDGVEIAIPRQGRLYGSGSRQTPELLDWNLVKQFCDSTGADVLLVLETFDSNSNFVTSTAADKVSSILSGNVPDATIPQRVRMNIHCFWRMYDPRTRSIVDQFQQRHYLFFDMSGGIPPLTALPKTAYDAGHLYIQRFLPSYYTVRRELYQKTKGAGKEKFKAGFRRAEVANWKEAIAIWEELIGQVKSKTAGKACVNIAVAYEALGDTELALQWAKRSYEDYGNELGRDYAKILLRRKNFQ